MRTAALSILITSALLSGCVQSGSIRTSANTMLIQTSAAPACGSIGAAQVAQHNAAVETIRAGFDRYIIEGAGAANNVSVSQMGGTYNTNVTGGYGVYNAQTTYMPGPMIYSGTHDQTFSIRMFKNGDPGANQALDARQLLGAHWETRVKAGPLKTCSAGNAN
jgi:hypothetical protein